MPDTEIVRELLLKWDENTAATPEELCWPYGDRPDHGELVDAVREAIHDLRAAAPYVAPSQSSLAGLLPSMTPVITPLNAAMSSGQAPCVDLRLIARIRCPFCQSPIELADKRMDDVLCPACSGLFRIKDTRCTDTLSPMRRLGKYQLLTRVGIGAFGAVWKARDTELDRLVALKLPHAGMLETKDDRERFYREARATAQLRHPNIITVHEVATIEGRPAIVSDFVTGISLSDYLQIRRPPSRIVADLIAQLAQALDYAHRRGIIHRDVKSSNIMLEDPSAEMPDSRTTTAVGTPLLTDFGMALRPEADVTLTVEGQIVGTPAYMSPEQAAGRGHKADGRSDIYSLGVVLYEMLTGELPFRGPKMIVLHQVMNEEPPSPCKFNPKIPRALESICMMAMAKLPRDRYTTAAMFVNDLRQYLSGQPITARRAGITERIWRSCRRHRSAVSCTALAVALLIAISNSVVQADKTAQAQKSAHLELEAAKQTQQELERDLAQRIVSMIKKNPSLLKLPEKDLVDKVLQDSNKDFRNVRRNLPPPPKPGKP